MIGSGYLIGLLPGLFYPANHIKCRLRQIIMLPFDDLLEPFNGLCHRHIFTLCPCKSLGHMKWLRQKSLDSSGSGNGQFIIIREFIHPKNSDDILKVFIFLKNLLDLP